MLGSSFNPLFAMFRLAKYLLPVCARQESYFLNYFLGFDIQFEYINIKEKILEQLKNFSSGNYVI